MLTVGMSVWLAATAALVAWGLITRPERVRGLLVTAPGRRAEPERVQLLAVILFAAGAYVLQAARLLQGGEVPTRMPEMPHTILTILAASQAVFLSGKITRTHKGGS